MSEVHSFGIDAIPCHAFNAQRNKVALSPNNNEVHIYQKEGSKWTLNQTLVGHDLRITSIDWAPNSNRIVTCSADRNAYVWSVIDGNWKPTLVLLRINRAATCVRWSPKEDKFAVGSGAKLISICYFEESNDWWVSKHIKKPIRSTVTSVDWHINNQLLACGSTDFKARIFSGFIKEVDKREGEPTPWGGKCATGSLIAEFSGGGGGWVHNVSFSPDGNRLAWVSHDSSISVADANRGMSISTFKTRYLPYLTCVWTTSDLIIAAGHDCCPMLFKYDMSKAELQYVDKVDKSLKKEVDGFSAMRKFRDMDKRAIADNNVSDTQLDTIHQNTITEIRLYSGSKSATDKISTISVDGQMVIWDLKSLEASLKGLRIV
ncbi:actin-related protein 2/3 complex subunit 1A-like [Oppia nitens]|uniref:actin-related protein 2/3 complex subunit 1A-like n=1 Tax=Oppia nitens TaxID=1686743 RepID=UPI0023DA407D|nr:actin-related protein 2/3 complex subunit 1A-like [Oppia nitens]